MTKGLLTCSGLQLGPNTRTRKRSTNLLVYLGTRFAIKENTTPFSAWRVAELLFKPPFDSLHQWLEMITDR